MHTKRWYIHRHRELWDWLAKNPMINGHLTSKEEWPGWSYNGGKEDFRCFLCKYVRDRDLNCDSCPVVWERSEDCYYLYRLKWINALTAKTRSKYAAIIRDLPLK